MWIVGITVVVTAASYFIAKQLYKTIDYTIREYDARYQAFKIHQNSLETSLREVKESVLELKSLLVARNSKKNDNGHL